MNVDSGNGSLLLIDTERTVSGIEASVEFRILVRVIKSHKRALVLCGEYFHLFNTVIL